MRYSHAYTLVPLNCRKELATEKLKKACTFSVKDLKNKFVTELQKGGEPRTENYQKIMNSVLRETRYSSESEKIGRGPARIRKK